MRRILITGSNRGIGLELVKQYLQHADTLIFATCREPNAAAELNTLAEHNREQVKVVPLNVVDQASIESSYRQISAQVDGLEILINNAGILPGGVDNREANIGSLGSLDANAMLEVFRVNTISPIIMTQRYADLLRKGVQARVINVSSDAGSIERRQNGCDYSYPASKAALNMMSRCLAGDFHADQVIAVSMHPGWIQTEMGGVRARLTLAEAIPSMVAVIDKLTMADSGKFVNWDGSLVPW